MNREPTYKIVPQMKIYDNIGWKWLPFVMFSQVPNFRSQVLNTDINGFRYNSIKSIVNKSILNKFNEKDNYIILGNSTAFGVGATSDHFTISSNLTDDKSNFINLACRAHVGFQELISLFSNFQKLENIKKIIIISGVNDFYLSKILEINYPDNFYFYSVFSENMNKIKINLSKKVTKYFLNIFFPNILDDENIHKINKNNILKFLSSSKFRENFNLEKNLETLTIEQKFERNFKLYSLLKNYFNCEVQFYMQPVLQWSKDMSEEEKELIKLTNSENNNINNKVLKYFNNENYKFLSKTLKDISNKHGIKFFDINTYFRKTLKKDDWCFVDSVHCTDLGYKNISDYIRNNLKS